MHQPDCENGAEASAASTATPRPKPPLSMRPQCDSLHWLPRTGRRGVPETPDYAAISRQHGHAQAQASALDAAALDAIRSTAMLPRTGRRGVPETPDYAAMRGQVDIALCSLLSDAGLRRSEAAALTWGDVELAVDGSGRITITRSKTDQAGAGEVVAVTRPTVQALEAIRDGGGDDDSVFGMSESTIARRVKAAAAAAGLGDDFSGHSGRVGLAQRMTAAGAPAQAVMVQGRWKNAGTVARYTKAIQAGAALQWL